MVTRYRGKCKYKVGMVSVSIRIPKETLEFYKRRYPHNYTVAMREVLQKAVTLDSNVEP